MSELTPGRVKEIFHRAMDLSAEERPSFLDAACGSDTALRRRVEQLLESLEEVGPFLAAPTGDLRVRDDGAAEDPAGRGPDPLPVPEVRLPAHRGRGHRGEARNGPLGVEQLIFLGEFTRFESYSQRSDNFAA